MKLLLPPQVYYMEGAIRESRDALASLGKRALIVTGPTTRRLGTPDMVQRTLEESGIKSILFDGITGEPTDEMVTKGLSVYRTAGCDFLIGIGGGSAIDAMKAIAVASVHPGHLREYMGREITGPLPKMAAVPTTAGTGSEATPVTIITDTERQVKMLLRGDALLPDVAVIDPVLTCSAPPQLTAATGLDALTHAVEAYTSRRAQPVTDTFAVSAVRRIFRFLPTAYRDPENQQARAQLSLAALEAGIAFSNSSVTLVHGMSRPIGALFHVPHGLSNAMLLLSCLSYAQSGAQERFSHLAREIGAVSFLPALTTLLDALKIPTLASYGIDRDAYFTAIPKMSDDAMRSGSPQNTRREITRSDIEHLYRMAF